MQLDLLGAQRLKYKLHKGINRSSHHQNLMNTYVTAIALTGVVSVTDLFPPHLLFSKN